MSDKLKPGSYIDTQGMGGPADPDYKGPKVEHKPATVRPRRLFTETYAKELKILINEVLDERIWMKKLCDVNVQARQLAESLLCPYKVEDSA